MCVSEHRTCALPTNTFRTSPICIFLLYVIRYSEDGVDIKNHIIYNDLRDADKIVGLSAQITGGRFTEVCSNEKQFI